MFSIKLIDYVFTIRNRFPYIERICRDYITDTPGEVISISDEELAFEKQDDENFSDAYLESLAVYRKICERLLDEDILLFHCSALAIDGKAYLFTGPSGTGKSTHARLWRERFGEQVTMINDDKPLLAFGENGIAVYGTPYSGKHRLQTNTCAPVEGIVFLKQAPENRIRRMTASEAYPSLLSQTYRRSDPAGTIRTMDLVQKLTGLPVFALDCTISQEAVELAYQALTNSNTELKEGENNI